MNLATVLESADVETLAVLLRRLEKVVRFPEIKSSDLERITTEVGRLEVARDVGKAELVRDIRRELNNRAIKDEQERE